LYIVDTETTQVFSMKSTLILLHGALGSQKQFNSIRPLLESQFELHSFDFEGHGGRVSDKPFSMQLFSQNLIAYLDQQAITQADIFGYSMGGYVALKTALTHPERVGKILTLGTKFDWTLAAAEKEVRMLQPDKIEEKVPRFAQKLAAEHYPQDWKTVVRRTANMMLGLAEGEKLGKNDFSKIPHEVTIGIGSMDNIVSIEESEGVTRLLRNGTLGKLSGVEHSIEKIEGEVLASYISSAIMPD
jgi:pimeloyl-ACP methyl ester carboxylesterase